MQPYPLWLSIRQWRSAVANMHFCTYVEWYGKTEAERSKPRGGCMTWQEHLLFHNNPNPFTEGMVLFKHPFHLCWVPALRRDGRVERQASKSADNVGVMSKKPRQKRSKTKRQQCLPAWSSTVRLAVRWRHCLPEGWWWWCCLQVLPETIRPSLNSPLNKNQIKCSPVDAGYCQDKYYRHMRFQCRIKPFIK